MTDPTNTTKVLVAIECWVEVASYGEDWNVGDMVRQARRLAEDRLRAALVQTKTSDIAIGKVICHQVVSTRQS